MQKKELLNSIGNDEHLFGTQHGRSEEDLVSLTRSENEESKREQVSTLKDMIRKLEEDNMLLEKERESLEIDNVCLSQQKQELESKIDDLARIYPSASILLGKTPHHSTMSVSGFKNKLFRKWKK